jgi:hypothetical protein
MTPEEELKKEMVFKRGINRLNLMPTKSDDYMSPLNEAMHYIKGSAPVKEAKTIIKGVTDHIDTKSIQKVGKADAWAEKILAARAASALAKKSGGLVKSMVKGIPMIGGIAAGLGTLLTTGDASAASQAALPLVGDSDDLGPSPDSLEHKMESGTATPDELDQLRKRFQ